MYLYPTKEILGMTDVLCDDKNHYYLGIKNGYLVMMTKARTNVFSIRLSDSISVNQIIRTTIERIIERGGIEAMRKIPSTDKTIDIDVNTTHDIAELFDTYCGSKELLLFKFLEKSRPLRTLVDKFGLTLIKG